MVSFAGNTIAYRLYLGTRGEAQKTCNGSRVAVCEHQVRAHRGFLHALGLSKFKATLLDLFSELQGATPGPKTKFWTRSGP